MGYNMQQRLEYNIMCPHCFATNNNDNINCINCGEALNATN